MQKYIYNNLVFIFLAMVEARDNSFNDSPLFPGLQKLIGIEAASLILENNYVRGFYYKKYFFTESKTTSEMPLLIKWSIRHEFKISRLIYYPHALLRIEKFPLCVNNVVFDVCPLSFWADNQSRVAATERCYRQSGMYRT